MKHEAKTKVLNNITTGSAESATQITGAENMKPTITICSDASYRKFHKRKVGAWACYIRTPNTTVKKSGVLKLEPNGATDAEKHGVAIALHIADKLEDLSQYRVIVYCDNINAMKKGGYIKHTPKSKYYAEEKAKQDWFDEFMKPFIDKCAEYETRHVRGHLKKSQWHPVSKRNFMNDWCDQQAKLELRTEINKMKKAMANG